MKKKIIIYTIVLVSMIVGVVLAVDTYIRVSTSSRIVDGGDYSRLSKVDCILVLGAGVWGDKPSPILEDRLLESISAYESGVADKIIMTGDHGRKDYDEVNIMKEFVVSRGIPSDNVFMDHAGFSTYESMYRAKEIFGVKKVVIVTQKYHLHRALYIAKQLGMDAYGVSADPRKYAGQLQREVREVLARNKDFVMCIFKPKPTYLGKAIFVSKNGGDVTNDK